MSASVPDPHILGLRRWATGTYTEAAAVELLVRAAGGTLIAGDAPWVRQDSHGPWVDWEALVDESGHLSGGERRIALIAASLAVGHPVSLSDALTSLDREHADLVLAAFSHATGSHEHSEYLPESGAGGVLTIRPTTPRLRIGPLHPWPGDS